MIYHITYTYTNTIDPTVSIPWLHFICFNISECSGGVVGYHVCLTRTRSRVRSSPRGVLQWTIEFLITIYISSLSSVGRVLVLWANGQRFEPASEHFCIFQILPIETDIASMAELVKALDSSSNPRMRACVRIPLDAFFSFSYLNTTDLPIISSTLHTSFNDIYLTWNKHRIEYNVNTISLAP